MFSKPWPAVELKKVVSVTNMVQNPEPWQRKPNAMLKIYKAFEDSLTFLNWHMILWFNWICSICEIYWKHRTAGHLVLTLKTLTGYRPYRHSVIILSCVEVCGSYIEAKTRAGFIYIFYMSVLPGYSVFEALLREILLVCCSEKVCLSLIPDS